MPAARVRIWDLPTRAFHWLLVLLIPGLWWTAEYDMLERHILIGQVALGLIVFRLVWGVIGSSTARFASFVKGPRAIVSYLQGRAAKVLGHNPLGGWSVVAMLAVLCAQVSLGLFAMDEDGLAYGPLAELLSFDTATEVADWHGWLFNVLLALIALHVAAILFYAAVRPRNLIGPMITGSGTADEGVEQPQPASAARFFAALAVAVAVPLLIQQVS